MFLPQIQPNRLPIYDLLLAGLVAALVASFLGISFYFPQGPVSHLGDER